MEASGIATKVHLIALKTYPLNKCKLSVKPQTHLFCKSSLIIFTRFYSASPTHQRWPRPHRFANARCCSKDINSFGVEAHTDVRHDRTVRVKLVLQKECEFGEGFCVVGEEPVLGSWNPQFAIPMTWSSGHIWTTPIMDIPLGKRIYFKFILRDKEGEFHWQPGPDRVFQPWETRTTLLVSQDWYDVDLKMITAENTGEEVIREALEDTEIEDREQKAFEEARAGIIENGKITGGVPVLVPGLAPISYGDTEIEDQEQEAFEEGRTGIHENDEITGGVPVLVPGLAPISYTDETASIETLGETENEDQVVEATQEEIPESRDRIVERGETNGGVPVLVPGLTSISFRAEDCSSTGEVYGAKTVSTVDMDCSAKDVEYPGKSSLAISETQEIEKQQQKQQQPRQDSSPYAQNGSVMCNNHASLSGEDDVFVLGTTEKYIKVENEGTSTAKEMNENKDTGASSESSCNEQENFSAYESEPDSSIIQKDFDWGRAALSKLIWSLGLKND